MPGRSPKSALALSLGSWYLKRLIHKRGAAALAAFVAGEGVSLRRPPSGRRYLRWILVAGLVLGGGLLWWRRRGGGGDDWGEWEPAPPVSPVPSEPAPMPEPLPDPVTT